MDDKSAIAQMYHCGRGHVEKMEISRETSDILGDVDEKYNKLKDKLSSQEEIWQLFKDFEEALSSLRAEEAADSYAEGFKFGLLLGVEAGASK